ncbi:MFS transporter [Kitasatospora albolonga]|uniref:sporulation protein n=1 Tax=Kitasatospora albolonga TaxID=68173 RepID=UPI0031E62EF4
MGTTARRAKPPNEALARMIEACDGASRKALAHRVNQLAAGAGLTTRYTHTSVANWCRRGMVPEWPVPALLARAIGERLGRPVALAEIGMAEAGPEPDAAAGLDFPRDPAEAVRVATAFWSSVNRRDFLTGTGFAVSSFATPVTRWLVNPADEDAAHRGRNTARGRVGAADLAELGEAAEEARRWDSKYGGGSWRAGSVTACLRERAVPLLNGSFDDRVGRRLFSVTAELSRLAGWTAFDTGQHDAAQRHFIQALRLARAGGDVQLGCYVLTTMAMQTLLRGFAGEAVDMTQGAFERAKGRSAPRVLAFTKLIEARAHAREGDARAASAALAASERLLDQSRVGGGAGEPAWIDFYGPARLAADAVEVFRDLRNPTAALGWNDRTAAIPTGAFTRSVGLRLTVVATAHLQSRELERGLTVGHQALDVLAGVRSARAVDYVRDFGAALGPWRREPGVGEFIERARASFGAAAAA